MIAYKKRESRRARSKMAKNIEILYKEGKCRDCSVVVTRMDFAKILGKFTKVKIQYETNSSPKTPKSTDNTSPNTNTRLKSNENGMVLIHRNAYNPHPAKDLKSSKKNKSTDIQSKKPLGPCSPKNNILKESNNCKKTTLTKKSSKTLHTDHKQYTIIFLNPKVNGNNDFKIKLNLADIIPLINTHILPSNEWSIEYFPKAIEPKDDKMYNRIAAELEDLMFNKITPNETTENKPDEFPSIMDILNDNTSEASSEVKDEMNTAEFKPSLESSDVEAMLLGKPEVDIVSKPIAMDVDSSDVNKLIEDVVQLTPSGESNDKLSTDIIENPHSPSILDETLQKGIEEHLPVPFSPKEIINNNNTLISELNKNENNDKDIKPENECDKDESLSEDTIKSTHTIKPEEVTEVIFKKIVDGKCPKSVTCLKNLRYNIQLEEKSVEFLGAPKYISSIEDIQVLLQIVHESTLGSLYVLH